MDKNKQLNNSLEMHVHNILKSYYNEFDNNVIDIVTKYNESMGKSLKTMIDNHDSYENIKQFMQNNNICLKQDFTLHKSSNNLHINTYIITINDFTEIFNIANPINRTIQ